MDNKKIIPCFGKKPISNTYAYYHDNEWGFPVHEDQKLFEALILEGAQAGLSWETILKKRNSYKQAFHDFDILKVSQMSNFEIKSLYSNKNIIRNRLKIDSVRHNALVFLSIQKKFGSFNKYLWSFIDNKTIHNEWKTYKDIPSLSSISVKVSKALKKRHMKFIGPKIIYAYMQAIGMVNDHLKSCPCYKKILKK
ncbi:DNA-3-methyladenine glycosylase [PVC group bacterium (ex Bugula neritina AB1)]|nr:DNA-3-methyladenine glycosylase [PVC group bacterium (ex Bugula neritina AB1)]